MKTLTTARTIVLVFSLIALATPSQAAQTTRARDNGASLEQKCHDHQGATDAGAETNICLAEAMSCRFLP
jgi:hypothetical protein